MQELVPVNEDKNVTKRGKRRKPAEETTASPSIEDAAETERMTLKATCEFFGGDRPLNPSTLYRGVRDGQYPPPILLGPNNPRWLRSECLQAIERLKKERAKWSSSRWLRQAEAEATSEAA
jgi:predicted DNA-binding transcriptional regulator AlpA